MRIELVRGDITEQHVDAIVNAANSTLLGGGGVDGAIRRAAGPELDRACQELRATSLPHGLPVGHAVATTAGLLPARWVIHAVGPVYRPDEDRSHLLAGAYTTALGLADELGAQSVAFPAISTGSFGWPMADAARISLNAVRGSGAGMPLVRFVLFDAGALAVFEAALRD